MTFPTAPDVTLLLYARHSPHDDGSLTVGQLAGLIRRTAEHAEKWWHLVRFEAVEVALTAAECEMWLTVWPPGHGTGLRESSGPEEVMVVLAGELAESTTAKRGVIRKKMGAHRILVHGSGAGMREMRNCSPFYAISLHARSDS